MVADFPCTESALDGAVATGAPLEMAAAACTRYSIPKAARRQAQYAGIDRGRAIVDAGGKRTHYRAGLASRDMRPQ
jgi:hypothetical protein